LASPGNPISRDSDEVPDAMLSEMAVSHVGAAANAPMLAGDDEALAAQAVRSKVAFAELYRRHAARVYRYCLGRTGNVNEAQELTSETFIAAMEGIRSYRPGHFGAWLLGIARNKVALFYRRRKDTVPLDESEPDFRPHAAVEQIVGERLQLAKVARAMRTIAPERAEALSLRILGELPTAEVARVMGKSEPAVRMLISRALADLRERLHASGEGER
jgi:RNA polymerase sigma-70 factor, ECF subfamily